MAVARRARATIRASSPSVISTPDCAMAMVRRALRAVVHGGCCPELRRSAWWSAAEAHRPVVSAAPHAGLYCEGNTLDMVQAGRQWAHSTPPMSLRPAVKQATAKSGRDGTTLPFRSGSELSTTSTTKSTDTREGRRTTGAKPGSVARPSASTSDEATSRTPGRSIFTAPPSTSTRLFGGEDTCHITFIGTGPGRRHAQQRLSPSTYRPAGRSPLAAPRPSSPALSAGPLRLQGGDWRR